MIEARAISMRYGNVTALHESSFTARRGEVVGLLGPNGAGKTTTMRILTTYQLPSSGTAVVAGHDVVAEPLEVRRRIGYLPETLPLYLSMEVCECLRFVARARGLRGRELKERVDWVVAKCGLDRMYRTPVLELSKGFRQRTALAQALVHDPEVVILDEPTTGLDPHQILGIRALIEELAHERTVLLSTHILQEASALAQRLLVMSGGRIVGAGTADELRAQAGVRPRVRVAVRGGDVATLRAELSRIDGAGAVTTAGDGAVFDVVETAPGLLARVGEWAHARGLTVLELSWHEGSLEEMFLTLTRQGAASHAHDAAQHAAHDAAQEEAA